MKICQPHWDELRQKIKAAGLFDLVSTQAEVMERVVGELEGKPTTLKNFDPLMAANNMLWGNALQVGGLYLMGTDEKGNKPLPTTSHSLVQSVWA